MVVEVDKMRQTANRLTNLQLELIKLFSYNLTEKQMLEIKDLLARYFAEKATHEADKIWETKGLTNDTMDVWLDEHLSAEDDNKFVDCAVAGMLTI